MGSAWPDAPGMVDMDIVIPQWHGVKITHGAVQYVCCPERMKGMLNSSAG